VACFCTMGITSKELELAAIIIGPTAAIVAGVMPLLLSRRITQRERERETIEAVLQHATVLATLGSSGEEPGTAIDALVPLVGQVRLYCSKEVYEAVDAFVHSVIHHEIRDRAKHWRDLISACKKQLNIDDWDT
jgi:hypothetical protein